jgi:F0F1-type ATP synthase assembly protein I
MWLDCAMGDFALLNNQLTILDGLMCVFVCVCVFVLFVWFSFSVAPLSHTHSHIHNGKGLKVTPLGALLILFFGCIHDFLQLTPGFLKPKYICLFDGVTFRNKYGTM